MITAGSSVCGSSVCGGGAEVVKLNNVENRSGKILIIGAGLSGRIAKYIFGDNALLCGKLDFPNPINCLYSNSWLDDEITNKSIVISKEVLPLGTGKLPFMQEYLRKTIGDFMPEDDIPTSFGAARKTAFIINENLLPMPDFPILPVSISDKSVTMKGGQVINFDVLISTIPIHELLELFSNVPDFDYRLESYRVGLRVASSDLNSDMMQILYCCDDSRPYYKIIDYNNKIVYKYSEATEPDKFDERDYDIVLKDGRILWNEEQPLIAGWLQSKNIYCLGRTAQWNPRVRIEDVWHRASRLRNDLVGKNG